MTAFPVLIEDQGTGKPVDAVLTDRIDAAYAKRAEDAWSTWWAATRAKALAAHQSFDELEHGHWLWETKVKATAHLLPYPTMGIERDGQVQGLMLLLTDTMFCQLPEQAKEPLVYVMLLATAPWNLRHKLVPNPLYRGVGLVLLRAAVETSVDLGFKGRIGLHSLPRSESWYDKLDMHCLGKDSSKRGLKYYEMTAAQAAAFIK